MMDANTMQRIKTKKQLVLVDKTRCNRVIRFGGISNRTATDTHDTYIEAFAGRDRIWVI